MSHPMSRQWIGRTLVAAMLPLLCTCGGGDGGGPTTPSGPQTRTFAASDVPQAIRDHATVQSVINVSGMRGTVTRVVLNVNISHTFIGDLVVTAFAPSGAAVVLHNRAGGATDNLVASYEPSQLAGGTPNGSWVLTVSDEAAFDQGTLNSWSVTITSN